MWLITQYMATSLYSLKVPTATSSGGKTLLGPTPYALKMALLDIACRTQGVRHGQDIWPVLCDLRVAYYPPERAVVSKLFTRILKPNRNPPPPLARSIGYREYVYFAGPLGIAFAALEDTDVPAWLPDLAAHIAYLGKRGGFVQPTALPKTTDTLPASYIRLNPREGQASFDRRGILQLMDDCGPRMTFDHASIYSGKRLTVGQQRIRCPIVLPYRMARTSKGYTLYERLD